MQTGENEQALRKILDMTRLISLVILALHFYYYCYAAFEQLHLTVMLTDKMMGNLQRTGIFKSFHYSKLLALGFLLISLIGARGRKDNTIKIKKAFGYITTGLAIYFVSYFFLIANVKATVAALLYVAFTITGFLLILTGGTLLSTAAILLTHIVWRILPTQQNPLVQY